MIDEQKAARRRALLQCEEILTNYLVDWLTDTDDENGLVEGRVEGFEDVDPEVDGLRDEIISLGLESCA